MDKLLIYGGGLLGRQVHYLFANYSPDLEILGFVDDTREPGEEIVPGLTCLGSLEQVANEATSAPDRAGMALAIGYANMPGRLQAFERARGMGYGFQSFVHPRAVVERNVVLGEGCFVLAGAILDHFVELGPANYIDIGVLIGENARFGANNYLSSGTVVGGSVEVGKGNFFGLNCSVVNDVSIGNHNFINASALVHRKLDDNTQLAFLPSQRNVTIGE